MKKPMSFDLFAEFLKQGDELHKNKSINRKTTFHCSIENLGGEWLPNDYQFVEKDRILVREEVKKAEATYNAEYALKLREEDAVLKAWSLITYGEQGMEFAELLNYDGIDDPTMRRLKELSKTKNERAANTIIDAWTKEVIEMESDNPLIDGALFSKLLHKVDQTLKGYFIEDMELLIDLPFSQKGEIEIVMSGDSKIEAFNSFVWDNRQELKRTLFKDATGYSKPIAFKTIMNTLCKTLNWDFEVIKAEAGKVQAQKDLIAYYKKTKIPGVPKASLPQKQWLFQHLMFQRKNRRLREIELKYFRCMSDRAIIRQKPHILKAVFHRLEESRIERGIQNRETTSRDE